MPRFSGSTSVLGGASKPTGAAVKSLLSVASCTWISGLMTDSQLTIVPPGPWRPQGARDRPLTGPVMGLFVGVCDAEHDALVHGPPDELKAHWEPFGVKATGIEAQGQSAGLRGSCRRPSSTSKGVRGSRAERQRPLGRWARRSRHRPRRPPQISANQGADLLSLQIIGVVVAARERIGPEEQSAGSFGAKTFGATG